MKICSKCKIEKQDNEFYPRTNRGKKTLASDCKLCSKARQDILNILGYGSWHGIKDRCLNIKGREYQRYGAKGIFVCKGLSSSFKYFLSIVGQKPSPTHSIDRTNNNGSYTCGVCADCIEHDWPLNIRWATKKEQIHNRNPYLTMKRKENSGISPVKNSKVPRWRVSISVRGKDIHLGHFTNFEEAKKIRDNFVAHIKLSW